MRKWMFALSLFMIGIFISACGNKVPANEEVEYEKELTISAAISLTDALNEVKDLYQANNNTKLTFNFGGSGTLTQQIQQGAPVDIFISANQDWMNKLEQEELILTETREKVTMNRIVLISNQSADFDYESFEDISASDFDQIAIGNPESVPAGKYTEQILHSIDLWDKLKDKLILAKDVRQVLTYVESGNTDLGFVYESDARLSDQINVLAIAKEEWHDPIIYPGAVLKDSTNQEEATSFLKFLQTDKTQAIFEKYGFKK
ncbi:MAG TPA: molybdate ABC transporter substrate-binding protein [Candidatus Avamphibacillus sp.]|nr:molybdate ABC transporter substrate-binding protein [Candidatus Avamphibacillus sp.]